MTQKYGCGPPYNQPRLPDPLLVAVRDGPDAESLTHHRYPWQVARTSPSALRPTQLSPTEFASAVTAITSAFGDPTRREIYLAAHKSDDGVTASEIAERFDLHPNVARHHLDKLSAGGYLEITTERVAGGAGRPSKRYRTSTDEVTLDVPVRHDDVLVVLLGRALGELGPD